METNFTKRAVSDIINKSHPPLRRWGSPMEHRGSCSHLAGCAGGLRTADEIEWAPLMSNGAFPDPIHTLKDCSLKYNTFTEMNFNRFNFSNGNEIVGSMFAKCEMQLANFKGVELHETEFYQCDLRKADFRDAAGYKVDILGSRLKDAKFSLPEAVNLLADLKIKLS